MSDPIEQTKTLHRLTEILSHLGVHVHGASFTDDRDFSFKLDVQVCDLNIEALIRAETETFQSPDNRSED